MKLFLFLILLLPLAGRGITPQDHGAVGDARKVDDAVLNATTTVTSATAGFTSADVGKVIWGVENSTGNTYLNFTTIASVTSATTILTASPAWGGASGVRLVWGTADDSGAIIAAKEAAQAARKPLRIPAGGYIVRRRILGVSYPQATRDIPIIGEGSGVTTFYVCAAAFDYSDVGPYEVLLGGNMGHAYDGQWRGMTFDGCDALFEHPTLIGHNDLIIPVSGGCNASFADIRVENFKGIGVALKFYGNCLMERCHVEDAGETGIFWYGQGTVLHSYSGNVSGMALKVYNVTENGPFQWLGGIIDECGGPVSAEVENSKAVHFIGAILYAGIGRVALKVDGTSDVCISQSQMLPYGAHWGGALRVLAGGHATLSLSKLKGSGAGFYLDNFGTVWDGGGNRFTGNHTGNLPQVGFNRP